MQAFQKFIRADEIKRAKDIDREVNCCKCFFYDFLEVEYVIKLIKFSSYVKPLSGETPGDFAAPAPAPKQAFSGRYESWYWFGNALELRVDIDVRAQNSPVMNCVSGDIYHSNKYSRSWICTNPTINISNSKAEITGNVTYWIPQSIIVDKTTMHITIPRSNTGKVGPAVVTLNNVFPGTSSSYICEKKSHCFRSIAVEVDVTTLVDKPPFLPYYDVTSPHSTHPPDIPPRKLSYTLALREAGICASIKPDEPQKISGDTLEKLWTDSELHDAMVDHFSKYSGTIPGWNLWCLQCGFHEEGLSGAMFDAGAKSPGGANEPPERQGFAIFRNDPAFQDLVPYPASTAQAASMRWFLYTFVHETGHAFNLVHSDYKALPRPDALSWMNNPENYPNGRDALGNSEEDFWNNFMFEFDDEELIHLRHGNRAAVIPGGDDFQLGQHLEISFGEMSQFEGQPPIELLLRSQDYFDYLEPVGIEARVRNLQCETMKVERRLSPEYGGLAVYIRRPNGIVIGYLPIIYKEAFPVLHSLGPQNSNTYGEDRLSEYVSINYGKHRFYFDEPGEYWVRALYHAKGMVVPSNTLRLRVGYPTSSEESRLASSFFTYQVGMSLYLNGSQSPFLADGKKLLESISEKYKKTLVGAKLSTILAESEARPFFRIIDNALRQTHKPNYKKALSLTEPAVDVYRKQKDKSLNILYHHLVRNRANYLAKLGQKKEASNELSNLRKDLKARGVKESVLKSIESFQESLDKGQRDRRTKKR
jgi:hypothetical protein